MYVFAASWVSFEFTQETASYQMICRFSATRLCYLSEILLSSLHAHIAYLADSIIGNDTAASKQPCMDHEA